MYLKVESNQDLAVNLFKSKKYSQKFCCDLSYSV